MDIQDLKNRLKDNPQEIGDILEFYGYCKIKINSKEIRCARDEEGGANSIRIKLNDSLSSFDFVKNIDGDIFSLIMTHKNKSFYEVLQDIKGLLNIDNVRQRKKANVFGGMFTKLSKVKETISEIKTYDESILYEYENVWNIRFANDGISPKIQKKFKIGYDIKTHRISVPWFTSEGKLCGVMGRLNYTPESEDVPKWFPLIAFTKSFVLYGFSENYKYLVENETIFVGESEKFVLQLATMGYRNAVSLGGSNITEEQIKLIMTTNPSKIIMCWDEGLDMLVMKNNLVKFKEFMRFRDFELFVIIDKSYKYIPKGSKASPSDFGKVVFDKIKNECIKKIGGRKNG